MSDTSRSIHDELSTGSFEADESPAVSPPPLEDPEAEAAYWRARFEEERELLTKLWVAYRDVRNELQVYEEEAEEVAQRKAAAQLAQTERARAEAGDADGGEQPSVLAIEPPDEFEVICEAEERDVIVGRGTSFPLVFANRGQTPVDVELGVEETPEGWSALTTEREIELDPRSSRTVYVLARPSAKTPAGERARVTVGVSTSEGTEQEVDLVAEVVEPREEETRDEDEEAEAELMEDEGPEAPEAEVDEADPTGTEIGEEGELDPDAQEEEPIPVTGDEGSPDAEPVPEEEAEGGPAPSSSA